MSPSEVPEGKNSGNVDGSEQAAKASRAPSIVPEGVKERAGTVLRGKYHLDAVLGVGGMAVVYKATHRNRAEDATKRRRPEDSSNHDVRPRFVGEGHAANSLTHPSTVS